MKVFLSWSGNRSNKVAEALRNWLPFVVPHVEPYVSSEDIEKGARWATDIAKELEKSAYGLICLTKENVSAPWVLFEAGALSKYVDKSRVVPVLLDLKKADLQGPLLQFQAVTFDQTDIRKIVKELNEAGGDRAIEQIRVEASFKKWWPDLERDIQQIGRPPSQSEDEKHSTQKQSLGNIGIMLEEVLELSRNQVKLLRSPPDLLPADYLRTVIGKEDSALEARADVPPAGHPVWRDLNRLSVEVDRLIGQLEKINNDPNEIVIEHLKELGSELRHAIRYVIKDVMPMRFRMSARPRPTRRDGDGL
jgi:hypothetical protein